MCTQLLCRDLKMYPVAGLQVCVSKFAVFHDRQHCLANVEGSHPEVNCAMIVGMLAAR